VAPTTTTTVPGSGGLTLQDTGLTKVRVALTNQAAWVEVELVGTHIDMSHVVSTTGSLQITSLGTDEIHASGAGTAIVDLILRIEPGSATSLEMCKNYLGPATVSVRRRTDGDEVVGSIDNTGTDPTVPPGSCTNFVSASMPRADLIGPIRWPARRDPRPLVLANYYPWYDPATLAGPFTDPPTGPADTSNPVQVAQAVDLARSAAIDGFVVEYEATPAHEAKIDAVFAAADARPGFKMALMVDFAILEVRPLGLTAAGLDAALDEVASHAGRPSQLKIGSQPVAFVYGAARVDPSSWSAALGRLHSRTGINLFVVSDDRLLPAAGRYDYGTHSAATVDQLHTWAMGRLRTLQQQPSLYDQPLPLWVAPVSPGYDDRALGRPSPVYVPRNGGLRYEQAWDAALESLPDWILITSWNEWFEGTSIEPGRANGDLALRQTAELAAAWKGVAPTTPDTTPSSPPATGSGPTPTTSWLPLPPFVRRIGS
jgi:hypothetical protein